MSICNPCTPCKPVLACTTNLTICTIANLGVAVFVYLEDHTTGFIKRYDVTSTGAGAVVIALSSNDIMPDHDYEVWVTLASSTNTEERLTMVISGANYTCVKPTFRRVYGTDNVLDYGDQTLAIAS